MEQSTYDPIVENRTLSRFRLLSPLRPPDSGTALVLVPHRGESLTVLAGEPIPDARYGAYQHMYLVDIAEHALTLDLSLPSRDHTFAFQSRVRLVCRVAEPAEVVRRGIRDMSGAMHVHFKRMLRDISRDYDISEFHDAERALNSTTRAFTGDAAIRLRNVHVELLIDEDEAVSSGRNYRDLKRRLRLEGMARDDRLAKLHTDGAEGLLAEIYEREGPRATLDWIHSVEADERRELLAAWETLWKHSHDEREPFDVLEAERVVRDRLVGGSAAPFGGVRSSRLRGVLPPGTLSDEPAEEDGSHRDGRDSLTAGSSAGRTRADRYVRGAGPPADEAGTAGTRRDHALGDRLDDATERGSFDDSGLPFGAAATPAGRPPADEPAGGSASRERRPASRLRGIPAAGDPRGRGAGR